MYDYLLKLEAHELTRKASINWERLMEIRHLKDRMIRKCQRLGRASAGTKKVSRGEPFAFQSITAPSDFRLKEMEKWFREQQKRLIARGKWPPPPSSRGDASGAGPSRSNPTPSKPTLMIRSSTNPSPPETPREHSSSRALPVHGPPSRSQKSISLPAMTEPEATPQVFSPSPLPMLLLVQREQYGLEPSPIDPPERERVDRGEPVSEPVPIGNDPPAGSGSNTPDSNGGEGSSGGQLRRRRSCIKRSSMSDLVKTVSWADTQELDKQISKYAAAAKQAQASGTWNEVRVLYLEQLRGLENLHEQVREGIEQLRSESEQLYRMNDAIQRQRSTLQGTFQEFEDGYTHFQEKVREAISEATNNVNGANGRLELPPINEDS
ncbi:hypothetical protein EST38_g5988 [Candolleomyces aberdarensis]|uniref:Uncharacterized protein n=1 Tax=Candolleomyces aberdarensis TaxID=2316362 RepID=A0A4Q2DKX2_9AGAR|nr:hypothetical protein EST38_g5988 [Candolleomyces aberdarensis]